MTDPHLPSHCNIRRKNPSSGTYNSLALLPSMPGLSVRESYIPTTTNWGPLNSVMTHIEKKQKDFSLTGMVIHFRLRKSTNALGVHFSTLLILGKTMVMLVIPNDRSGARRQHGRSMQLGEQKGCQQRTLCREKRDEESETHTCAGNSAAQICCLQGAFSLHLCTLFYS